MILKPAFRTKTVKQLEITVADFEAEVLKILKEDFFVKQEQLQYAMGRS